MIFFKKKKHVFVFVDNCRTVIARKLIFFLENIDILIFFRMPSTTPRYIETFSRNYDFKKDQKMFDLQYLWNLWTNHFS